MVGLSFYPSKEQAVQMNVEMHSELCRSLSYLADHLADVKQLHLSQTLLSYVKRIQPITDLMPEHYGYYYNLAFNMLEGDFKTVEDDIQQLCNLSTTRDNNLCIHSLNHPDISQYQAMFLERMGENAGFSLSQPTCSEAEIQKSFTQVLSLIKEHLPDLYGELEVLLRRIIIVKNQNPYKKLDGAAIYQLWRTLFLNEDKVSSVFALLETIIHEATHIFLFGCTIKTPLTLNNPDEKYYSAIRQEERPIDGIFHALIVNARLVWAMDTLRHQNIDGFNLDDINVLITSHTKLYHAHYEIIEKHGLLSPTAKNILTEAHNYMSTINP